LTSKQVKLIPSYSNLQLSKSDLILNCFQVEEPGQKITRFSTFSPSDWETILIQSRWHGLTSMLAWQINELGSEVTPPEEIRQSLRQSLLVDTGRNLLLFNELGKLLRQFNQAGIPIIVLKGAHLAAIAYEHIGLRTMADIDLMVHLTDMERSCDLMTQLGYHSQSTSSDLDNIQFVKHHLPDFYRPNTTPVEIHWTIGHLSTPFRVDLNGVWERAQTCTLAGEQSLILSPTDLIVYLCMHAYAHNFSLGLKPFIDLLQVNRHYQEAVQWGRVKQRAHEWKANRCVYCMFYTANRLFGSPSETELEALRTEDADPRLFEPLINKIMNVMQADSEMKNDQVRAVPSLYYIKLIGNLNFAEKAALFWNRIFLPPKTLAELYTISPDSPWLYFYYLLRAKGLLSRYGRLSIQKATGGETWKNLAAPETRLAEWIASE
jgi:hypothetical protein